MNPSFNSAADCFALLDDCDASEADPRSRLHTGYLGMLRCNHVAELPGLLVQMQEALEKGQHAVGLFTYELGEQLHGIQPDAAGLLAQVLLFSRCQAMTAAQVDAWLAQQDQSSQPAGIAQVSASITEQEFADAVARIHAYIEAGDTYQINYTYRMRFDAYGSPIALYRRLRARQPVPYGALVHLPDGRAVLSLSPELFMRYAEGGITARPMKGTAAASGNAENDAERASQLSADPKNRAENLMIVDLLRNDIGRIASIGSVRVPKLFNVERYNSVLQMTSTVQAQLRPDVSLTDVFHALYPCGSITGAPKRRTMQIIRELESAPRGLYTGAIGWFDPPQQTSTLGNFCLSVPIRTLALQAPQAGIRKGEMGVGAGIVHDSTATEEFAECRLKARFLTGLPQEFELFETMHATRNAGVRHFGLHMQRLSASASYFGFPGDEQAIRAKVQQACELLPPDSAHRLRLALKNDGSFTLQSAPLAPLQLPVRLLLASEATAADNLFLSHKTTMRESYDLAWRAAEQQGAFDMLFFNERGELTEGGRSSVFVKLDGGWFTPPLASGVLPGVMRSVLLADPAWNAQERLLTLDDLRDAQQVIVCNALRDVLPAVIIWP